MPSLHNLLEVPSQEEYRTETPLSDTVSEAKYSGKLHYRDIISDIKDSIVRKKRREEAAEANSSAIKNVISDVCRRNIPGEHFPKHVRDMKTGLQAYDLALHPAAEQAMYYDRYAATEIQCMRHWDKYNGSVCGSRCSGKSLLTSGSSSTEALTKPQVKGSKYRLKRYFSRNRAKGVLVEDSSKQYPWLKDRLEISCRSCRFELPMDMLEMKDMTVQEYLLRFCRVPRHREIVFKNLFDARVERTTGLLPFKVMEKVLLNKVLLNTVGERDLRRLFRALNLHDQDARIGFKLFTVICAVAERILYVSQVGNLGQTGLHRGYLESADFYNLQGKLRGMEIDPYLKNLLLSLG